jgi:hypothetical protein
VEGWPPGGTLCLDLARTTGAAYGTLDCFAPWFEDWHMPSVGGEGARFAALENEIVAAFERFHPCRLVLEAPIPLPAMNNRAAAWQQLGMRAIVRCIAYREAVAVTEVSATLVRSELLGFASAPGKPNAVKSHVLHFCRRKGWDVPSHNAGDACMLWEWQRRRLAGERPVQPAFLPQIPELVL